MDRVTVSQIRIRNVLGIEELDVAPGALTLVTGANGSGKTSVLEALKSVVAGGHDATLIRNGADHGEVVLVLDDGMEIRKRITGSRSSLSVKHPELGEVKAPQAYVDRLMDALAFNPVAFLTADPKRQTEYLLEALPLQVTADELAAALGQPDAANLLAERCDGHALEVIERARKQVFDERTGVNRAAKEKRITVEQLSASLPAEVDGDGVVSAAEFRTLLEEARLERNQRLGRLQAERDRDLEALRERTRQQIEEIKAKAEKAAESIRNGTEVLLRQVEEEYAPAIEENAAKAAAAEVREREGERHANTREVVNALAAEAGQLEAQSAALTRGLNGLEGLKARLLERLPLKGVEIRDGEVYKDDVPFSRVNAAERVKVAMQLAALRAKGARLPLVCVDGLECLDEKTFQAFCRGAPKAGLQFIVTRVGTEGLKVDARTGEPALLEVGA